MRKGSYISTYSKIKFWPLDPRKEEIKTMDIAHALSMMCRGNGHYDHFYSVAQHSINCTKEAELRGESHRVQLACLLHDASEAYISDITRPVKRLLDQYRRIEEKLQNFIFDFYGIGDLSKEEEARVKDIDDSMLDFELKELLENDRVYDFNLKKKYDLSYRDMREVRDEFVNMVSLLID